MVDFGSWQGPSVFSRSAVYYPARRDIIPLDGNSHLIDAER